jgi:hypothetical protein
VKTILIIGGYGGAGSALARLLLAETDVQVVIGGRNLVRAQEYACTLNREYTGHRACAVIVDAADPTSVAQAIPTANLVLVAATSVPHVGEIAAACLAANVDYLDIHFGLRVYPALLPLATQIERAGRLFITQAGFHPGLPAALIRHIAPRFDRLDSVSIGMLVHAKIETRDSAREFVDEFADFHTETWRDEAWRKASYKDTAKFDFGARFGRKTCYPMFLDELRPLPQQLRIRKLGLYIAGFDPVTDLVVFPLLALFGKSRSGSIRDRLARLLVWSTTRFFKPPEAVIMIAEAFGLKNERPFSVRAVVECEDAYRITAAPVVAGLKQYLDNSLKPMTGLRMMGHIVEPNRFFSDLQSMKVRLNTAVSTA